MSLLSEHYPNSRVLTCGSDLRFEDGAHVGPEAWRVRGSPGCHRGTPMNQYGPRGRPNGHILRPPTSGNRERPGAAGNERSSTGWPNTREGQADQSRPARHHLEHPAGRLRRPCRVPASTEQDRYTKQSPSGRAEARQRKNVNTNRAAGNSQLSSPAGHGDWVAPGGSGSTEPRPSRYPPPRCPRTIFGPQRLCQSGGSGPRPVRAHPARGHRKDHRRHREVHPERRRKQGLARARQKARTIAAHPCSGGTPRRARTEGRPIGRAPWPAPPKNRSDAGLG